MAVVVTIGGEDRTSNVVFPSLRKIDKLNQEVDTLDFTTRRYGSITYVPTLGDEVVVTRDGDIIFGGVIVRITETVHGSAIVEHRVQCNDYSQYLKRQLVTERYENMTANDIIADLVANYTDDDFTVLSVNAPVTVGSISFNRMNVADCLQRLADAIAYVWYVDFERDIHFFAKNAEAAPFDLTDTSGNYIYDSLNVVEDLTQLRNSVLMQGGEEVSATPRMEFFSGDATRTTFALANKYDSLPDVEVGGVPQTVGVEFLNDDAAFDCMWNFNEKYIRFTAGNTPASGTNNIEVEGTYLYPIVVSVPAPSSQAQFGVYEFAITDRTIRSQAEAIDRALAELRTYQREMHEGFFRTYEDGLRSGQVINITSAQRGRNIDVLIQSVTATMRDPSGERFEYEVRFATLKSIGIIEYLQNQLRSKDVFVDDQETLLNYFPLDDTFGASDELAAPVASTGPYKWFNDVGTTPNGLRWGYGKWS